MASLANESKEVAAFWGTVHPIITLGDCLQHSVIKLDCPQVSSASHFQTSMGLPLQMESSSITIGSFPFSSSRFQEIPAVFPVHGAQQLVVWFQEAASHPGPGNKQVLRFAWEAVQLLTAKPKLSLELPQILHENGETINRFPQTRWLFDALEANGYLFISPGPHHSSRGAGRKEQEEEHSAVSPHLFLGGQWDNNMALASGCQRKVLDSDQQNPVLWQESVLRDPAGEVGQSQSLEIWSPCPII